MSQADVPNHDPAPSRASRIARRLRIAIVRLRALVWTAVSITGKEFLKGLGNKADELTAVAVCVVIVATVIGVPADDLLHTVLRKALGV